MVHRGKEKRVISDNFLGLFQDWLLSSGRGYNDGYTYHIERTLKDSNGNFITFHLRKNKLEYWIVNNKKKHTQTSINDFIRICKNKYDIVLKLSHYDRL